MVQGEWVANSGKYATRSNPFPFPFSRCQRGANSHSPFPFPLSPIEMGPDCLSNRLS